MKALRYCVLFLVVIIGLTAFSQPGSYYPPPGNVEYHNDTLTICPPDSLPGEPVILIAYNIYVDSVFFDNITVTNPTDTIDYIFTFPALPPGDHAFCAKTVYNQWISDQACDSATVIYGYELPFLEDWSSGTFEDLQWVPSSGNWIIDAGEGNPAPAAEFQADPVQMNYIMNLESYPINALDVTIGKIWLDFDLNLNCINPTGDELMGVQVWNSISNVWTTFAIYSNDDGSFTWSFEHLNIQLLTINKMFKVRFQATGNNSADIQAWHIDNIHLYRQCWGAVTDLSLSENSAFNKLNWIVWGGPCFYEWIHWDDGNNSGNSIGTGEAVEFDVAARWTPQQLAAYPDAFVTRISFFPSEPTATYNLRLWQGSGPDTLLVDQPVQNPIIGQWNELPLSTPIPVNKTIDLWVGYHVITPTGYPAGVDAGPAINSYGNMMNFGGWHTLLEINPELDFNWNIECLLQQIDPNEPGHSYNIYRQTGNEEFQFYDNTENAEFIDSNIILSNRYCYKVTMESFKNGDTCESDPTNTACEIVNVGIIRPDYDNSVKIYPIPAKNWLNIESEEEMREIRVYNLLGKEVLKLEIGNLENQVDVSRLQSGIYYVTVETEKKEYKAKVVILK